MNRDFTVIECEQRSPEWFQARNARLTSSNVAAIFKSGKKAGEPSVECRDTRVRMALESITGRPQDDGNGFVSKAMQHGIDAERAARLAYEAFTGAILETTGFIAHNTLAVGASLDAHVDDFVGVVELKCPKSFTHLEYLRERQIPKDYLHQIRHQIWITGAQWGDFVSYDDRMPEPGQLLILRYRPTTDELRMHEKAVKDFLASVALEMKAIEELIGVAA